MFEDIKYVYIICNEKLNKREILNKAKNAIKKVNKT